MRVLHTEAKHVLQPEMTQVFDDYARRLEMLPVDKQGSKVAFLKGSERTLLVDVYVQVS